MSDETDHDHWLEEIRANGLNLSTWEEDFVESLTTQREAGRKLSEKQAEILERIYTEKTP